MMLLLFAPWSTQPLSSMPLYKFTSSTESSEDRSFDDFFVKCRLNHSPISHVERAQLESLIYETSQALQSTSDPGSRDRLSEILVFQRSLLSPIRCLPPDIMGEIFSFTIAGNPIQYGSKKSSTTIDAWKLTWVCTWWRDLALSQPALWSSMKFSFGHRDSYEKTLFLKEYIIPRSRLMPLDLSLEPYYIPYSFTPGSGPVLNVLVDEVERWKHLKLLDFNQALIDQLVAMIISKQFTPEL
ncbi:hypothetical protein BDP27DRAFT_756247 [Rhodocollybia butyracea]|uniref:F-box domain-containing protein n=1 Tax=Rhodocollybia butyracea TaxID=206335 RepID=A0A9P5U6L4_9AGAR|nr:hypothetical protein BDP27DRAFT_756247 [Rhodocollybia butyracea]